VPQRCGRLDVSHLGTVRLEGPMRSMSSKGPSPTTCIGSAQVVPSSTHLLDEEASVLDDIIIWWVAPERST